MSKSWKRYFEVVDSKELTETGRPKLKDNEVVLSVEKNVHVYQGSKKVHRDGVVTLTSERLFYVEQTKIKSNLDNVVKWQFHLSRVKYNDKISIESGWFSAPKLVIPVAGWADYEYLAKKWVGEMDTIQMAPPPQPGFFKLSFHSNGEKGFAKRINQALERKAWIEREKRRKAEKDQEKKQEEFRVGGAGLRGLIKDQKLKSANSAKNVNEAFADLETLMEKASTMVKLANKFAASNQLLEKRKEGRDGKEGAEASNYDELLHNFGISNPVTKDSAGSAYHEELSKELAEFLKGPLEKSNGILTLIDVYCLFNRARGSQLISPSDLLHAVKLFPRIGAHIKYKEYEGKVRVLLSSDHNDSERSEKILSLIQKQPRKCISALTLSSILGVSLILSEQELLTAEKLGYVCRDDSAEGLLFWENIFK